MKRYPCRCRTCGGRRTLAQHPEDYIREPHCACGGSYRVDKYRKTREHKKTNCFCSGYPWSMANGPHRRGSPNCYHRCLLCGAAELEGHTDDCQMKAALTENER